MITTPPEFGPALKRAREARKVSQSKLADRAGFDHSYVSRLEAGARTPTRDAVDRLGEALELPKDEWDALRYAAGFRPEDPIRLAFDGEPQIVTAVEFFRSEQVSAAMKANIWNLMEGALDPPPFTVYPPATAYCPIHKTVLVALDDDVYDFLCRECRVGYMAGGVIWRSTKGDTP